MKEADPVPVNDQNTRQDEPKVWLKSHMGAILKTLLLFYCMFNFGLQQEIIGPSVPTLVNKTDSSFTQMGRALACKSAGLLFGAFIGGAVGDRIKFYRRDFALSLCMISTSIEFFFVSYVTEVWHVGLILFCIGVSHSVIQSIINVNLSELWHGRSGPAFNFIFTGLGIGAIFAALLMKNFTINEDGLDENHPHGMVNLMLPFTVTSSLAFVAAVLAFVYFAIGIYEDNKAATSVYAVTEEEKLKAKMEKENNSNSLMRCLKKMSLLFLPDFSVSEEHVKVYVIVPFVMFFLYGIERVIGSYLFSYLVNSKVQFTTHNALFTVFLFWLCFTIGRIVFLGLSSFIVISYLCLFATAGTLVSFITFSVIESTQTNIYTAIFFVSFFSGALFPSFIASVDQVMRITGLLIMCVEIGGSFGAIVLNQVIGYVMDTGLKEYYPISLTITAAGLIIFTIIFITFVEIMRRKK